jgi:hypothetical protein
VHLSEWRMVELRTVPSIIPARSAGRICSSFGLAEDAGRDWLGPTWQR